MCSVKKVFLKISNNLQVFCCEFYKIFKKTFFYRIHSVGASANRRVTCS